MSAPVRASSIQPIDMHPRRTPQGNISSPSSAYVKGFVNAIFNDLISFMHGTVCEETDGRTLHHRKKLQPSAIKLWYAANPLPLDRCESKEHSREYRTWLEPKLIDHLMHIYLPVWESNTSTCPLHIARQKAARTFPIQ